MAGSISILGLGSSALNADTIDQLKAADEKILLAPAQKRAERNIQQREDFQTLVDGLKGLQSTASYFADEISYLKRSTTVSGDGGTISAESGVSPQSGKIYVEQLAQRSILQSRGFATQNEIISASGGETLTIALGPDRFEIDITAGMSLSDLQETIRERTGGAIEASILNTGGDEPYSLVLKSKDTGSSNEVSVTSSSDTFDLGFTEIQKGQDAKFTYNGIAITRESNTVDDLLTGVTITLDQADEYINFEIKQNLSEMSDKFEEFVNSYNETMALVAELTDFDEESSTAASFQGDSRVNSIRTSLSGLIFKTSTLDMSMTEFGLDVTQDGVLTFNKADFEAKMAEDPEAFESFFRGNTEVKEAVSISGKVGYSYQSLTDAQDNSDQSTYLPIEEDVTVAYGSVNINGVALPEITLLASNTPEENTQLLVKTINSITLETGVKASVSGSGDKVILTNESGGEIDLSGATSDAVNYLGLSNSREIGSRDYTDGLFSDIDNYFEGLLVGEFSTLGLLESSLKSDTERLDEEIAKTTERINQRYEIMEAQFASYNSIIKQFESSFSALQMQIDTMTADKG